MRLHRDDAGMTLVEVMAAMLVFAIVTLGVVPLLLGATRGAVLSRSYTVGKNIAVEAMERARGLPYFVDYPTQDDYVAASEDPRKVDLLDLYFPDLNAANYSSGTYTTTCSGSDPNNPATGNPACPDSLPAGHEVEYRARFVKPVAVAGQEKFTAADGGTVVPPSTYRWNPEPYTPVDVPPSQLLELVVKVTWNQSGRARSFELAGLIGERNFGEVTVHGVAKVKSVVEVMTNYADSTGARTQLQAIGGAAETELETKTSSTADQTVNAAELKLLPLPSDTADPIASVTGAVSSHHSPPDSDPLGVGDLDMSDNSLVHPDLGSIDIAGIEETFTQDLHLSVSDEQPNARGSFLFQSPASTPAGEDRLFWANGQLGPESSSTLHLDGSEGLLSFVNSDGQTLTGQTSGTTVAVEDPSRKVETIAEASFGRMRLLPTNLPVVSSGPGSGENSVLLIDDFTAKVSCSSTATASASALSDWSATLLYYQVSEGGSPTYTSVPLDSDLPSDQLSTIGNPLVYDGATDAEDIYLLEDTETGKKGYLRSLTSLVGEDISVDASGRSTHAAVNEAISVVTAPTDPAHPDSTMAVGVGNLSCEAVDDR